MLKNKLNVDGQEKEEGEQVLMPKPKQEPPGHCGKIPTGLQCVEAEGSPRADAGKAAG